VGVGYYDAHADKVNSFQLLLTDRSEVAPGDVDITFNYGSINWETGDASDGSGGIGGISARAGYSAGTGIPGTWFELRGSGVSGALMDGGPDALRSSSASAEGQAGRHVFAIRNN
jgi:Nidogen-like